MGMQMPVMSGPEVALALQSLGLSKRAIVLRAMAALSLMTFAIMALGELWGSTGDRKAQEILSKSRKQGMSFSTGNSLWIKDGPVFINAKTAVASENGQNVELWGVRILNFQKKRSCCGRRCWNRGKSPRARSNHRIKVSQS